MGLFSRKSTNSCEISANQLTNRVNVKLPDPLPRPAMPCPKIPEHIPRDDDMQLGMWLHEQNSLEWATYHFSVSAASGNPLGLVLFAISVRHGWGVQKDEVKGYKLLEDAASIIATRVSNSALDSTIRESTLNLRQNVARHELTMAIFELAMSYKQGWGVEKSAVNAAYYLMMAAQLGDKDAQIELAECYLRGDGVKKDKKLAAKWFREAERQGAQLVSMQWIWKEKYNQ